MAFLCEYCGAVWDANENINVLTGHMIQTKTQDDEFEYSFIDVDEKNEDKKSVMYSKFK